MAGEESTAAPDPAGPPDPAADGGRRDGGWSDGSPFEGDHLDIRRLTNLRDLGGLPTADGRKTRSGVLYRSEAPRPGDARPPETFGWPPPTVIDLRSAVERGSGPHPLAEFGSTVHVMPLLGEDVGQPGSRTIDAATAGGLHGLYASILDLATPRLVEILDIAAEEPGPVLVHCAAGKDRTGVVVAILLRLAGVGPDHVLADYLATAENMPGVLRRLRGHTVLPGASPKIDPELTRVSPAAAENVLTLLDGHPEGPEGWLLDRGARESAITAWRERFVG